jgi:hypothetical protein
MNHSKSSVLSKIISYSCSFFVQSSSEKQRTENPNANLQAKSENQYFLTFRNEQQTQLAENCPIHCNELTSVRLCDLFSRDNEGSTPLHKAAFSGSTACLSIVYSLSLSLSLSLIIRFFIEI